ncbi:hypothetical protein [Luteolibacter soli]|uniref:DUF5666 domain-containing protein n=1 Tax=Luteolibacter soli TaxID=3135280 RepID=A0ABU9B2D2_9BACT
MKIRASLVLLAAILACPVSLAADAFVLARKDHTNSPSLTGKSVTQATVREMNEAGLTLEMGEKKIPGKVSNKEVANEVFEIISPVKVRRTLTSKTSESRMVVMENEQPGPEKTDPLQGLPVIIEEKDGKCTVTLEKGEATPEQKAALDELEKDGNDREALAIYGDAPRKPGDKWDVDLAKLPSFGGAKDLKGSFVVEFVEVKELQGTSCAVLKSTLDLSGTTVKEGDEPTLSIKMKGEVVVHRSLEDLVDLDSKMSATLDMDGQAGPGMKMKITGPVTMSRTATIAKP